MPTVVVVPRERSARCRFPASLHPYLVAVVDTGCPGEGEQQDHRQHHRGDIAPRQAEDPRGVVRAEQVEVRPVGVVRVDVEQSLDGRAVGLGVELRGDGVVESPGKIGIDCVADGEGERPPTEQVVHGCVEAIPMCDPFGGVLPDLADDVQVGVHRSHSLSKPLPKARRSYLGGHIEPPSVDAPRRPVLAHRVEVVDHLGICRVELGESVEPPPRRIVGRQVLLVGPHGKAIDVEPVNPR